MRRNTRRHKMINDRIKKDVADEFANLKESLQMHLRPKFDVSQTKQFLQTHIPKEIVYKSEILLDTLLNYLMEDAQEQMKSADVKAQNAFYDADFRKRTYEWIRQLDNTLALESDIIKYTSDPRLKQGFIASGITLIVGTGIALGFFEALVARIVAILLSAIVFKPAYDMAAPKAREIVKIDIDRYLEAAQNQVLEWMEKVESAFIDDFHSFCLINHFALDGKAE